MKKGIVLLTALLFAAGLFVSPVCEKAFAKELKIAYVDLAKVFDEYKKTKDSEKVLEEKGKGKEAERQKLVDESYYLILLLLLRPLTERTRLAGKNCDY